MTKLNFDTVVHEVQEVAESDPDKVFADEDGTGAGCRYGVPQPYTDEEDTGDAYAPVCLIGHWLHGRLNEMWWHELVDQENQTGIDQDVLNHYQIEVDAKTAFFLSAVQQQQDAGTPWKDAVETGLRLANERFADGS